MSDKRLPRRIVENIGSPLVDAPAPETMAALVRRWLGNRYDCVVRDIEPPARLTGGFDFWTYSMRVAGPGLPFEWTLPLVARVPPTSERYVSLQRESRLQRWAADHGVPTPRVLDIAAPDELFASPVQFVQRAPGPTMTAAMTARPWRIPHLLNRLGSIQAKLHAAPVPDWATSRPEWSIVERRLALVRFVVERVSHDGLASGLALVEQLRHRLAAADQVLCHGDFHPMNLLVRGDDTAVIDWTDAGIGDAHCDIARTAWLFRFASVAAPHRTERAALKSIAPVLTRRYLASYRRDRPIDPNRLRLWMPVHLLHAWAMLTADEMELVGPTRAGRDLRAGLTTWAARQFVASTQALPPARTRG